VVGGGGGGGRIAYRILEHVLVLTYAGGQPDE